MKVGIKIGSGVECAILSYPRDVAAAVREHRDALRALVESAEAT